MFSGIIEEVGRIKEIRSIGNARKIMISAKKVIEGIQVDSSIAIDGACLTVVEYNSNSFTVEAVEETIRKTTISKYTINTPVNLERAKRFGDRIDGHIVQGHIDCIGTITNIRKEMLGTLITISFPADFEKFVVIKGSIAIDGISLTVAEKNRNSLTVAIIPYTLNNTTLKFKKVNDNVNMEFDIIGKYVINYLENRVNDEHRGSSLLTQYLEQPLL